MNNANIAHLQATERELRCKTKLRARSTAGQKGEVAIAIRALNRMIQIAKPISVPAV